MQAAGLVNDHTLGCFRHDELALTWTSSAPASGRGRRAHPEWTPERRRAQRLGAGGALLRGARRRRARPDRPARAAERAEGGGRGGAAHGLVPRAQRATGSGCRCTRPRPISSRVPGAEPYEAGDTLPGGVEVVRRLLPERAAALDPGAGRARRRRHPARRRRGRDPARAGVVDAAQHDDARTPPPGCATCSTSRSSCCSRRTATRSSTTRREAPRSAPALMLRALGLAAAALALAGSAPAARPRSPHCRRAGRRRCSSASPTRPAAPPRCTAAPGSASATSTSRAA